MTSLRAISMTCSPGNCETVLYHSLPRASCRIEILPLPVAVPIPTADSVASCSYRKIQYQRKTYTKLPESLGNIASRMLSTRQSR